MKEAVFKKRANRVMTMLQAKGFDVPHTAVLEALACYEGFRSYKAFASTFERPLDVELPEEGFILFTRVFACGQSDGAEPEYCAMYFTQESLKLVLEHDEASSASNTEVSGAFVSFEFIGGDYRLIHSGIQVGSGEFNAFGVEKHAQIRVETASVETARFKADLKKAVSEGKRCMLWNIPQYEAAEFLTSLLERDSYSPEGRSPRLAKALASRVLRSYFCSIEGIPGHTEKLQTR